MKVSELIKVGDEIKNEDSDSFSVIQVDVGRYGLLVKGTFIDTGQSYEGFSPYELPPSEEEPDWNGWSELGYIALPNGIKLGAVGLWEDDPIDTIEEYDAKWEETLEQMRGEIK